MSDPAQTISPVMLDTVLNHLAPHFLAAADNDLPTARRAASHLLQSYHAATEEELNLAGEIITFRVQALEALSEAAAPDLSLNRKLRLRGSAVSLSRQSHKAQRKLDQLQRARQTTRQAAPTPDHPQGPDVTQDLLDFTRQLVDAGARPNGAQHRGLSRQQRRAAERIANTLRRNQEHHQATHTPAATQPMQIHAGAI
jgi:hypothetical protein